ncbi:hypothetical protein GGI25_006068 [Coemansia spiralis]|uniref:Uncharacterized protein n=2 Tax=Coemansia TaxID=4863 RepID=A0A9W8KU32_9FUNG|nr:hypothetical protein EDC05_006060 [Coemansia umbellata]KAJ2618977.1 hypothetical protein GGI26_006192 [Coemansia sp. RSA 1358]KAJ2669706.1 hypothetical protein GGI25_006068 [Coemansia spiralis]
MNNVTGHNTAAARTLVTVLASVGIGISGATMILCIWLCVKRRELRRMTIYQVILTLQVLEILQNIFNLIGPNVEATTSGGCRAYVFFSLVLSIAPLNLSVFSILYFQAVLLHNIPLHKTWPRYMFATLTVVLSVVPEMFVLFIPARLAGLKSFCQFNDTPGRRLFVFHWLVFYIWVALAVVIGIYSITTMIIAIVRRSHDASMQISCCPSSHSLSNSASYNVSGEVSEESIQSVVVAVVRETRKKRRRSSNIVVAKTLSSVIWFPVAPIVSLGFNMIYSIVWHYTKTRSYEIFLVDCVLQFLAVPLVAMTFYTSPPARRALRKYFSDRKRKPICGFDDGGGHRFDDSRLSEFCRAMHHSCRQNDQPSHNERNQQTQHQPRPQKHANEKRQEGMLSSDSSSPESLSTLFDGYFSDSDANNSPEVQREHNSTRSLD